MSCFGLELSLQTHVLCAFIYGLEYREIHTLLSLCVIVTDWYQASQTILLYFIVFSSCD